MPQPAAAPIPERTKPSSTLQEIDDRIAALIADRLRLTRQLTATGKGDAPSQHRDQTDQLADGHGLNRAFLTDVFELIHTEASRAVRGQSALDREAVRIDHVAIAVRDLEAAIAHLSGAFGFTVLERRSVAGEISGMETATLRAGVATIVLCQGTSPTSGVSRYIEHYGPGVQHVAIAVRDQQHLLPDLEHRGVDLLTGVIHAPGLDQSFTRREHNTGMQWEFVTRTGTDSLDGFDDDNVRELFQAMEREGEY